MEIKYKELSTPLKIAVIVSYTTLTLWIIAFIVGIIQGLLET